MACKTLKYAESTAKRRLRKHLQDSEKLVKSQQFQLLFNDDPSFNPFKAPFWLRTEADLIALRQGCLPNLSIGLGYASFYPTFLRHTRRPHIGKPFFLLPWQRDDFLLPMMSWQNARGKPRIRKADFFSAKKNGKTTFCTGLIMAKLKGGAPNIETYNCSYTKDQAAKLFRDTSIVIEASPLKNDYRIRDHKKRIDVKAKKSFFRTLPGERGAKAAEGIDATLVIMDEIHLMADRSLYDFVDLAGLAQDDFLLLSVSTVGKIDKTAIWMETYERAKDFMSSKSTAVDYFGLVYEADPAVATSKELRQDIQQLHKANPSLKVPGDNGRGILDPEILLGEIASAEAYPAKLNNIIQKIFNVPVAKSASKCISVESWKALGGEMPNLEGRKCFTALDMASTEDLAAITAFFPFTEAEKEELLDKETLEFLAPSRDDKSFDEIDESLIDQQFATVPGYLKRWVFCPAHKVQERLNNKDPYYDLWAKSGSLIVTPGRSISHKRILREILRIEKLYSVAELAYDPWGSEAIIQYLEENSDLLLVRVGQTHKELDIGCRGLINLVVNHAIRHEGCPLMEWVCSNVAANEKIDAIKFDKDASADKIDPFVSAAMAVGRACLGSGRSSESYFDDDGNIAPGMYF